MRKWLVLAPLLGAGVVACVHDAGSSGDALQSAAAEPVREMFQDPGPAIATMAVAAPVPSVASWELHMSGAGIAVEGKGAGGQPEVVYAVALDRSGADPVVEQGIQVAADVQTSPADLVSAIRDAVHAYEQQTAGSEPPQFQDVVVDDQGGTSLTSEGGTPLTSPDGGASLVCRVWSWVVGAAMALLSSSSDQTHPSSAPCGAVGPGCQTADTGSGGVVSSAIADAIMYGDAAETSVSRLLFSQRTADLQAIDQGQSTPDASTRLGAYAATAGYPPGTVGHGVHACIGKIYQALGTAGQEQIGTFFNSAPVQANLNHPIGSGYNLAAAQAEYEYWTNILDSDRCSLGGYLGSAVSPSVRAYLQKNVCDPNPPVAGY